MIVYHDPVWVPAMLPVDADGNTKSGFECAHELENGKGGCGSTVFRVEDAVGRHSSVVEETRDAS